MAKEGAMKNEENHINLIIPDEFDVQGLKLNTLTQAIAYRGIKVARKHQQKKTCLQLPYNALLCLTEPVRHNKAL